MLLAVAGGWEDEAREVQRQEGKNVWDLEGL